MSARPAPFEANDVDRLLRGARRPDALDPGWSSVADLLESLRATANTSEVTGGGAAVLGIAALIRSSGGTSNGTSSRGSSKKQQRTVAEKIAASLIAAAFAGTTSLVVAGGFPHGIGRAESASVVRSGGHGPIRVFEGTGPTSHERAGGATHQPPAKVGNKSSGGGGGRVSGQASATTRVTPRKPAQSSRSRTNSPREEGASQHRDRRRGGDRGNGKDRGWGNDDRDRHRHGREKPKRFRGDRPHK